MKYITKEVRIGIAGIVALCVLIYGINWLKGIHMFHVSKRLGLPIVTILFRKK